MVVVLRARAMPTLSIQMELKVESDVPFSCRMKSLGFRWYQVPVP
jgi:hypothetical protein